MPINKTVQKNIEVEDVSFSYGDVPVLEHISISISSGDYVGLLGPNGAGKSTLIKLILGLLNPRAGTIKLFDEEAREFNKRSKISYVAQAAINFDSNFPATVREVVLMGRYAKKGLFRSIDAKDHARVSEALAQVEMQEYGNRLIGDLSGGQKQRVFIARALVSDPEIIFLDEPTTGVDAKTENEFYILLKKLNSELGLTLILVSHDAGRVAKEVKRIICIDRTVVCDVTAEEFLRDFKENFKPNIFHHEHP